MDDDGYVAWHQDKLWALLPAIYRMLDAGASASGAAPDAGPLKELVNRIGAQFAVVRRGIDRLWENQSIETCDDWVIPYIGDLLATRLVACLDASAQRLDVAKTIYYRRRAGTLGVLEELTADIARRDARCVEFFRRLGRTRHQWDPPIGPVPVFEVGAAPGSAVIEGLAGACSGTPAGGFADLRNAQAATLSSNSAWKSLGGAFDEFAHTADLRRGVQSAGWHNISHLGVFIWWLHSYAIEGATPVSNGADPPCFTFDPSGRRIALFARPNPDTGRFGENWVSPQPWDVQAPIPESSWTSFPDRFYPDSLWVGLGGGGPPAPLPASDVSIHPEQGVFSFTAAPPDGEILTGYHLGFSAPIGAGPHDERLLGLIDEPPILLPQAAGGGDLTPALAALSVPGTVEILDCATYAGPTATLTLPAGGASQIRSLNQERPLLRWTGGGSASWTLAGSGEDLTLQGMWLQGADLVLTGAFETVRLRFMTLDPGTAGDAPALFGTAIDGPPLAPTTLWVEGSIANLVIERSITGPIRARNGGAIETLTASDSILQSIPTHLAQAGAPLFEAASLAGAWKRALDPVSAAIVPTLPQATRDLLAAYAPGTAPGAPLVAALTAALAAASLAGFDRAALESAYPLALADLALAGDSGEVDLARCTVLGPIRVHRLSASECILDDIAVAEDSQDGCVRFSAYAAGSVLHQPYRCVRVPPRGPLFRARRFGQSDYARLFRLADAAMLAPGTGDTILGGAENGAEMGAFATEKITLLKRGLALKFEEYAPLGVYPVWIEAD